MEEDSIDEYINQSLVLLRQARDQVRNLQSSPCQPQIQPPANQPPPTTTTNIPDHLHHSFQGRILSAGGSTTTRADQISADFNQSFPGLSSAKTGKQLQQALPHRRAHSSKARFSPFENSKKKAKSWTHEFICLSDRNAKFTTSSTKEELLRAAGLGRKKILFQDRFGSHSYLRKILENHFPRLRSQQGAFHIAKAAVGGNGIRQLQVLECQNYPDGYSIVNVREELRSSVGFIIPLNESLNISPLNSIDVIMGDQEQPTCVCSSCKKNVQLNTFVEHKENCLFIGTEDQNSGPDEKLNKNSSYEKTENATLKDNSESDVNFEDLQLLKGIFPKRDEDVLKQAIISHNQNLNNAILSLSTENNSCPSDLKSAQDILQSNISSDDKKLKAEQGEELEEAFCLVKDKKFDLATPIKVRYKRQPAIDTGGVVRHFYASAFRQMACPEGMDGLPQLFSGDANMLYPTYNSHIAVSGVMVLVGKVMAHALLHQSMGPGFLSNSVFEYICSGTFSGIFPPVEEASAKARHYIEKICGIMKENGNLEGIRSDPEFTNLLSETGSTCLLTIETANQVIQEILLHDTLFKRKVVLDQIREGLASLKILQHIVTNKELYRPLFVSSEINREQMLTLTDVQEHPMKKFVEDYILHAEECQLKMFLVFVTGAPTLPLSERINVKFEDSCEVVASTCTYDLTLPIVDTFDEFQMAIQSVIKDKNKSFNFV